MAELFDRRVSIQIETIVITGLRVQFKVEKTDKPEPNTLDLAVYNLSETTRRSIQKAGVKVIVEAGYAGTIQQIYSGDARYVNSVRQNADWVTKIQCGDGEKHYSTARTNESFAPGTKMQDVAQKLIKDMKLGAGNVLAKLKSGNVKDAVSEFMNGLTVSGKSSTEFDKMMKAAGLTWSIQDGELQVTEPGAATDESIVVLSSSTGLIGSPEVGEKGIIKVKSLLQPGIKPARRIDIQSESIKGLFRPEKVMHTGDTHGPEWYTESEVKPL
jgi:hypothetical protein